MSDKCFFCGVDPPTPEHDPYCSTECAVLATRRCGAFPLEVFAPVLYQVRHDARKRAVTRRQCWPKVQHIRRNDALTQRDGLLRADIAKDPATIRVYECSICHCWHVGHRIP